MATSEFQDQPQRSLFGELLLQYRTERGFTQETLAHAVLEGRISSRSITNYEKRATRPQDWVLPHRPSLRSISLALQLDDVDHRALVLAWEKSRSMRDTRPQAIPESDFVTAGREDIIDRILSVWKKALAGEPQIVVLEGVAGIGKSSLARYICDYIGNSIEQVMIAWGSTGSWSFAVEPYLAIRSATDTILRLPDTPSSIPGNYGSRPVLGPKEIDHIQQAIPLLGGALLSHNALRRFYADNNAMNSDDLDHLLATKSDTISVGRFEEYVQLIFQLSQSWPLFMVFEDMHWSGDPSAALLTHIVRKMHHVSKTPLMIVTTHRPEALETLTESGTNTLPFQTFLNAISYADQVSRISLNETSPDQAEAFVEAYVRRHVPSSLPDQRALVNWLLELTSGHPWLVKELIATVVQAAAAHPGESPDGSWFEPELLSPNLPTTISTFMRQRVANLPQIAEQVLEVAAVMGDAIMPDIVAQILQLSSDSVTNAIEHCLVDTHHVLAKRDPLIIDGRSLGVYRFADGLFREYCYHQLGTHTRERLHRSIADILKENYLASEVSVLSAIAGHYAKAHDWSHAAEISFQLAQFATSSLDWDLANVWFDQSESYARKARDPRRLWHIRAARLALMRDTNQLDEGVKTGTEVLRVADMHQWEEVAALAHHYLGELQYDLADLDIAVDHLEQAARLHEAHADYSLWMAAEAMLSYTIYRQGRFDVALGHARTAMELNKAVQNTWEQPSILLAAANCALDLGFHEIAIRDYETVEELSALANRPRYQYLAVANMGLAYVKMHQPVRAAELLRNVLSSPSSRLNSRYFTSHVLGYLGYAYETMGDFAEAMACFRNSIEQRREAGENAAVCDALAGVVRMTIALGDREQLPTRMAELLECGARYEWEGLEEVPLVYLSLALGYQAMEMQSDYGEMISKAHTLINHRASLIHDPAAAESYLTNVTTNRSILSRFEALQGDRPRDNHPAILCWAME